MNLFKQALIVIILIPTHILAWKMESGSVVLPDTSISNSWHSVTLQQTYDIPPLIFALANEGSGYTADTPTALRIRNITTTGFEIVQVEPNPDNGTHPSVNINYIAIDEGEHTLGDGSRIVAKLHSTSTQQGSNIANKDKQWDSITFATAFTDTPIVLGMIQDIANETSSLPSSYSSPWMSVAMDSITTSGLNIAIEKSDTPNSTLGTNETIAYLVMEQNIQSSIADTNCSIVKYETILTSSNIVGWDSGCTTFDFLNTYSSNPNILGTKNSLNDTDGGWLRQCSLSTTTVGLVIDEDQSDDKERRHNKEIGGIIVFERDFVYDFDTEKICNAPTINLQMDECFWSGGANGITGDVLDSSSNLLNATSRYKANNEINNFQICRAGHFGNIYVDRDLSDTVYYPNETTDEVAIGRDVPFSFSIWVYRNNDDKWMGAIVRSSSPDWVDGWGLAHYSGSGSNIDFYVNNFSIYTRTTLTIDTWTHISGSYDGTTLKLYKNGILADTLTQTTYNKGTLPIAIGDDMDAVSYDDRWMGELDEVKIWKRILGEAEIKFIYDNESIGLNYDGSTRVCEPCNGASISAETWEMISIPAEMRGITLTVDNIFSDDMVGTFGVDWVLFKRGYSTTDNSSVYVPLGLTDPLEFGTGYWLASFFDARWYINGTTDIDFNSTQTGCTAPSCVEIELTSASLDGSVDDLLGSGPYRYTLNSFANITQPIDWADCRFIISDLNGSNLEILTPTDANVSGYANKQIWLYNPSNTGANSNGYTVCDDTSPGGCKLLPFDAFWVELHGSTKNKIVKLLIPKE